MDDILHKIFITIASVTLILMIVTSNVNDACRDDLIKCLQRDKEGAPIKVQPVTEQIQCPACNCHCEYGYPPPPPPVDHEFELMLKYNSLDSLRRTKWYSHDDYGILYPDERPIDTEDEDEEEEDDEDDAPIFPFDIVLSTEYTPPRCDYTPPEMVPCAFHCGCDNVPIDWGDIEEPEDNPEGDNEIDETVDDEEEESVPAPATPIKVELMTKHVDCPNSAQAEKIEVFPGRMEPYYVNTEYQLPEDYVGPTYDSTGPRDKEQDTKH
jgi:hypothetical protein